MTTRTIPELGSYSCDCGLIVWAARAPEHYAQRRLVLEEHAGGPWIMADDGTYQAARVGLELGDLKLHVHHDEPALGDVVELHPRPARSGGSAHGGQYERGPS